MKAIYLVLALLCLSLSLTAQNGTIEAGDGIILGDNNGTTEGAIRFDGSDFYGRAGGLWKSLTSGAGGGGSSPWTIGGTDLYYLGGNVGIGTSTPTAELEVMGEIEITDAAPTIDFNENNNLKGRLRFTNTSFRVQSLGASDLLLEADDELFFHSVGGDFASIYDDQGRFGINTTTPSNTLDVKGDIEIDDTTPMLELRNASTIYGRLRYTTNSVTLQALPGAADVYIEGGDDVQLSSAGGDYSAILDQLGRFGINTSSPTSTLEVNGDMELSDGTGEIKFMEGGTEVADIRWSGASLNLFTQETNSDLHLGSQDDIFFRPNNNEVHMTLTNLGRLGLGTSNPDSELQILSDMSTNEVVDFTTSGNITSGNDLLNLGAGAGTAADAQLIEARVGNDIAFQVNGDGFAKFGTQNNRVAINPEEVFGTAPNEVSSSSLKLYAPNGNRTVGLFSNLDGNSGGWVSVENGNGNVTIELDASHENTPDGSGQLLISDNTGTSTILIEAKESTTQGSHMQMKNAAGDITIDLDADFNGDGRVITDEIEIKGGSDFAENFDIVSSTFTPLPGMVVSIDPASTGKLIVSEEAYDRKVAGIISGANGIETGLFMGQEGSIANGDYPIALSGRVYVLASEEGGKIMPGDILTTSSTKGYAMKAADYEKSHRATIGKAMTEMDENGYVLVLVSLQ